MAYHILTRTTEDSESWTEVIDLNVSWKKAVVMPRIFLSEAECKEYIEAQIQRGTECGQFLNEKLHKIVEIE